MPRLFNLKYKELFVCLGFVFIAFAYPWIFQTCLINTGIVGIDMVIPLMSSAILIT
ncbi:CPBP family intramembrane metalloprotease, partial [Klebsiella pneumoniae]|nr:CPBP family intramembrane metalloprotease [Klebsiella pneumoniae]